MVINGTRRLMMESNFNPVLLFSERPVKAKGLLKANPNLDRFKALFFEQDYLALNSWRPQKICLPSPKPILFYPGCGADVLFPLLYLEKLFSSVKEIEFLFVDKDPSLGIIKTVLDDVQISFAQAERPQQGVVFYWKETLIRLNFIQGNVFEKFSLVPDFDLYFERAFRIFKSPELNYEKKIFQKLKPGGLLISDSGFAWLSSKQLQRVKVSRELSSYGEMIVGVKEY